MGPGMMVGRSKDETIRSHTDLQKNNAPHFKVTVMVKRFEGWEGGGYGLGGCGGACCSSVPGEERINAPCIFFVLLWWCHRGFHGLLSQLGLNYLLVFVFGGHHPLLYVSEM